MLETFWHENRVDENGNPAGGSLSGKGLSIEWQDGPLGRGEDRKEPNGAFVETVIAAAKSRLVFYQESKFACADNAEMIEHLDAALAIAARRTARREAQQVEGTHALDVPEAPPVPPPPCPLGGAEGSHVGECNFNPETGHRGKPVDFTEEGCLVTEADLAQFAEKTAATAEKLNNVLENVPETGTLDTEALKGGN